MKLFVLLLIFGISKIAKTFNVRSIGIVKNYLTEYQKHQNIPCSLHFLDKFVDFGLSENFHFILGNFEKPQTTCNIFICKSNFSESEKAKKIDRSNKDHLWIIDGNYSKKQFSWPTVEVLPKVTKLYCPKDVKPKLILKSRQRRRSRSTFVT